MIEQNNYGNTYVKIIDLVAWLYLSGHYQSIYYDELMIKCKNKNIIRQWWVSLIIFHVIYLIKYLLRYYVSIQIFQISVRYTPLQKSHILYRIRLDWIVKFTSSLRYTSYWCRPSRNKKICFLHHQTLLAAFERSRETSYAQYGTRRTMKYCVLFIIISCY